MSKTILLSLMAFSVACGTAEKDTASETETEPSSQPASAPTTAPEPQEVLLYLTDQWSGSWTVVDGALSGTEELLSGQAEVVESYNCHSVWDMVGATPETVVCEDCVWEIDLSATFNAESSTDYTSDSSCGGESFDFTYAYTLDYQYTSESGEIIPMGPSLLYGDADNDIGAFVVTANPNNPDYMTQEITWDEASGAFSYTRGYVDYEYLYTY